MKKTLKCVRKNEFYAPDHLGLKVTYRLCLTVCLRNVCYSFRVSNTQKLICGCPHVPGSEWLLVGSVRL